MTPNKHFNTYKEGLDLEFLREYCMEHGERRTFERGETLEEAGEPAQWVAFVERGCFKYMVHNDEEGKDYCTGFAFEGEFVSDFPYLIPLILHINELADKLVPVQLHSRS